ncbi:unnamed protein product [Ectocarpus fasciculatus]
MSFFTRGLAGIFNNNGKARKKAEKRGSADKKKEDKEDEGSWERLTDAYGRMYWKHSKTGEWHYGHGGGFVPPVGAVNPSPMGYHTPIFTPSPAPGGTLYPVVVAPPPAKKKEKDEKKEKGKGWWETKYDEDGDRYWEHTVTKKTTYTDPYY